MSRMRLASAPLLLLANLAPSAWAESSIHDSDRYSWGANIGWVDWRGDQEHRAAC